jgi:hypothetical protein
MADDPEPKHYRIEFTARLGFKGDLRWKHFQSALVKDYRLLGLLAVLILVPPIVMSWLALSNPAVFAGFKAVLLTWFVNLLAAATGFKAIFERITIREGGEDSS